MRLLLASNRSYRLYIGHGNWINLDEKSTDELLKIFSKGVPAKYQLAPGLFLDIIPHDVDFNSTSIDMKGLMRADLVYESITEDIVHKDMSCYIKDLLDQQNIVDAFPHTKQNESLPRITSLPSHRHLSLIPSVSNSTRRKSKSFKKKIEKPKKIKAQALNLSYPETTTKQI